MKLLIIAVFTVSVILVANETKAFSPTPSYEENIAEHGGGCRKSSPAGQCCHMDRKAGVVHCH